MKIPQNMGDFERILRVILGLYFMLFGFFFVQGSVGAFIGVVALVSFATGLAGFCPLYTLLRKQQPVVVEPTRDPAPESGNGE